MTGRNLSAPSGEFNSVSVAVKEETSAGDFIPTSGMTMGNITLSQWATINVSGGGGRTIKVIGGQFVSDQFGSSTEPA